MPCRHLRIAERDAGVERVVFVVVVFESEEEARAREEDPRRQEPFEGIRAAMGNLLSGLPEFSDCTMLLHS